MRQKKNKEGSAEMWRFLSHNWPLIAILRIQNMVHLNYEKPKLIMLHLFWVSLPSPWGLSKEISSDNQYLCVHDVIGLNESTPYFSLILFLHLLISIILHQSSRKAPPGIVVVASGKQAACIWASLRPELVQNQLFRYTLIPQAHTKPFLSF